MLDLRDPNAPPTQAIHGLFDLVRSFYNETAMHLADREQLFRLSLAYKQRAHQEIDGLDPATKQTVQDLTGILLRASDYDEFQQQSKITVNETLAQRTTDDTLLIAVDRIFMDSFENSQGKRKAKGQPSFEVHSLTRAQRVGPDYNVLNQVILTIMQRCQVRLTDQQQYEYRGGCTLVFDIDQQTVRFVHKGVLRRFRRVITATRLADELLRRYNTDITEGESPFAPATWPTNPELSEPFALLHRHA